MVANAAHLDDTSNRDLPSARLWDNLPESKLELIDGRLLAGNSLAGSRLAHEPPIEIRSAEDASPRQRAAFGREAMDVGGA